jgi:hypothetical protein
MAVLMTTRLLPGAQRIGPSKWRWGCWEITYTDAYNPFWLAVDMDTDFGEDPSYALSMNRVELGGSRLKDVRWFVWELADKGQDPLTAAQVEVLRQQEAA